MIFKIPLLMLALLSAVSAQVVAPPEDKPRGDDIVYSPHGILYTNTQHNFYTAGRCSSRFKFRRNYLKTMALGYRSFKQDNDNERTPLLTTFLDTNYLTSGDTAPKPIIYNKWYTWFSNRQCTVSSPVPCGMPGICYADAPLADMIMNLVTSIFHAAFGSKTGHYCAGSHGEDALYDCCSGLVGDGGVYKLVRSGWTMRKRDGTGDRHEMPYLFVNRGGSRKLIIECRGDDIWFGDDDLEPSFVVFSHQQINGDGWIYRSPNGEEFYNSRDIGLVTLDSFGQTSAPQNVFGPK
ncbi:hypothetical protein BGZ95_005009 [Linnemannia exigua]|uniref:Uncharacterized protein n=1 Tax=Linnemannia exigua TaxID=604196 RepID=A0AAD4DH04_9FUNG|nr:hypothetical protein BGZ95_005009 [Linnemannia exigua]